MARILVALLLVCLPGVAADWTLFKSGPIEVYTNGSDDAARRLLATFDQARWLIARWLGRTDVNPLWTVRFTMAKSDKAATQYRTPHLTRVRDGYVGGLTDKDPIPTEWLRDFVRILLRDDAKTMAPQIETALIDLVSTLEVKGVMLTVGTPPPAERRTRDWARLHLLCVDPVYAGRVRVFFSNLQQDAPLDTAYRNAFERPEKQMEAEVDRYFQAGQFNPQQLSGKPLNVERDYRARVLDDVRGKIALADALNNPAAYKTLLNGGAKIPEALEGAQLYTEAVTWKSESAPAWVAAAAEIKDPDNARQALLHAMDLNKRWTEPHVRLAALETDAGRKAAILKRATALDPRATNLWVDLAESQQEAKDYSGASLSWRNAEHAASSATERAAIEKRRKDYEQRRLDLIAADKKREAEEKARELAVLREQAMANIRAAEQKANSQGGVNSNQKVVEWWDGPKAAGSVQGKLERVDCLRGQLKLSVRSADGKLGQYGVPNPSGIVITGGGEQSLACGPQRPPRAVKVDFNEKNEVLTVEFQQ